DMQRSEAAYQPALRLAQARTEYDYYRSDYGSPLRDGAAMLARAAESKPVPGIVPQQIRLVARERADARWTSTQDESRMLLAARALKAGNDSITLSVNGA